MGATQSVEASCGGGRGAGMMFVTPASSPLLQGRKKMLWNDAKGKRFEMEVVEAKGKQGMSLIPSVATTEEGDKEVNTSAEGLDKAQQAPSFAAQGVAKDTDYMELPQPVRYEELQKECLMSLRPETFEGMRFDFTKPLNQR